MAKAETTEAPTGSDALILFALGVGYVLMAGLLLTAVGLAVGSVWLIVLAPVAAGAISKVAFIGVLLAWCMIRPLFIRVPPPPGINLAPGEAPTLWALVNELRAREEGPRVRRILVQDRANAAAVRRPRLGLFGWPCHELVIGLPFLLGMSETELRAVISHEYRHLSRAHGRLDAAVYRLTASWEGLAQTLHARQPVGGALVVTLVSRYHRWLSRISLGRRRAHEYEADAGSMAVAGRDAAGAALLRSELLGRHLVEVFWPRFWRKADDELRPLVMPWQELRHHLPAIVSDDKAPAILTELLAVATDPQGTHPCLAERLRALGAVADLPPKLTGPEDSAGARLLGDTLDHLLEQANAAWWAEAAPHWEARFRTAREERRRLTELDAWTADELSNAEAVEHAGLIRRWRSPVESEALLRVFVERRPECADFHLALAVLLLDREDAAGIAHAERAADLDAEAILPACRIVLPFLERQGREADKASWLERGEARMALERAALAERDRPLSVKDRFAAHNASACFLEELGAILAAQPAVRGAWLVRREVELLPERPAYVLVLRTLWWRRKRRLAPVYAALRGWRLPEASTITWFEASTLRWGVLKLIRRIPSSVLWLSTGRAAETSSA